MSKYMQKQLEHKNTADYFYFIEKFAEKMKPKKTLEIGFAWGISTIALLKSGTYLLSVDKAYYAITGDQVDEYGFRKRWEYKIMPSKGFFAMDIKERYDLIYIDGSHYYLDVKSDLDGAIKILADGGKILLDDYFHRYNYNGDYGVKKAVDEFVKKHSLKLKTYEDANGFAEISV